MVAKLEEENVRKEGIHLAVTPRGPGKSGITDVTPSATIPASHSPFSLLVSSQHYAWTEHTALSAGKGRSKVLWCLGETEWDGYRDGLTPCSSLSW